MEIKVSLQDPKNIRENITFVTREEVNHYLENSGFVVNRGFKARVEENGNKENQVRNKTIKLIRGP